jgi:hypothetical protein
MNSEDNVYFKQYNNNRRGFLTIVENPGNKLLRRKKGGKIGCNYSRKGPEN